MMQLVRIGIFIAPAVVCGMCCGRADRVGADAPTEVRSGKPLSRINQRFCNAVFQGQFDLVKQMLEYEHVSPDSVDSHLDPALNFAAEKNNVEIVKLLLQFGADKNKTNADGTGPAFQAARAGSTEVLKILLDAGVSVDTTNGANMSFLSIAAFHNRVDVVKLLIARQASFSKTDINGQGPLHAAAASGNFAVLKLLLQNKAPIDATNNNRCTPLWVAANRSSVDTVKLLLEFGADRHKKNFRGVSPVDFCGDANVSAVFADADIADVMLPFLKKNFADLTDEVKWLLPSDFKKMCLKKMRLLQHVGSEVHPDVMQSMFDLINANELKWRHVFSSLNALTKPMSQNDSWIQYLKDYKKNTCENVDIQSKWTHRLATWSCRCDI